MKFLKFMGTFNYFVNKNIFSIMEYVFKNMYLIESVQLCSELSFIAYFMHLSHLYDNFLYNNLNPRPCCVRIIYCAPAKNYASYIHQNQ